MRVCSGVLLAALVLGAITNDVRATAPIECPPFKPLEGLVDLPEAALELRQAIRFNSAATFLAVGDLHAARLAARRAALIAELRALRHILPTPSDANDLPAGYIDLSPTSMLIDGKQIELARSFQFSKGKMPVRLIVWEGQWGSASLWIESKGRIEAPAVIAGREAVLLKNRPDASGSCTTAIVKIDPVRQLRAGPHCGKSEPANTTAVIAFTERLDIENLFKRLEVATPGEEFLDGVASREQRRLWNLGAMEFIKPLEKVQNREGIQDASDALAAILERARDWSRKDEPTAAFAALETFDDLSERIVQRHLYDCLPTALNWPAGMQVQTHEPDYSYFFEDYCPREPPTYTYNAERKYEKAGQTISIRLSTKAPYSDVPAASEPMILDNSGGLYDGRVEVKIKGPTDQNSRHAILNEIDTVCLARVSSGKALE